MRPGLGVSGRPISPHFPHEVHRGFLGRAAAVNTYGNSVPRGNSETLEGGGGGGGGGEGGRKEKGGGKK